MMSPVRILLAVALLLTACSTLADPLSRGDELTIDQYESIRPGMTAEEIRKIYGEPADARIEDGRVWRYSYRCWDEAGTGLHTVDLEFDRQQILVKKSFW